MCEFSCKQNKTPGHRFKEKLKNAIVFITGEWAPGTYNLFFSKLRNFTG